MLALYHPELCNHVAAVTRPKTTIDSGISLALDTASAKPTPNVKSPRKRFHKSSLVTSWQWHGQSQFFFLTRDEFVAKLKCQS